MIVGKNIRLGKILHVDDHPAINMAIAGLLTNDAEVKFVQSTSKALELLPHYRADLIISDVRRPGDSGLDFLDAIRGNPQTRYLPFIFLSISDEIPIQQRAFMQGCDEFISKSSSATFIKFRIVRLLERALALKGEGSLSVRTETLKVFISYAKEDAASASQLCSFLSKNGVNAWLDEKELKPGQEWNIEIRRALRASHAVIICLSTRSISKSGFVQKEVRMALDLAEEQPPGAIFIIPLRIEPCLVPEGLTKWQWLDFYHISAEEKLLGALQARAEALGVLPPSSAVQIGD